MYKICILDKPQWLQGNPRVLCCWMLKIGCYAFSEYAGWHPILPNSIGLEHPSTHFSMIYDYFNWVEDA